MGYGGVLAVKRSDHSSDYAFDFSQSDSVELPDIADYSHYELGEELDYDRVAYHDYQEGHHAPHYDYVEREEGPHRSQFDYVEREAEFSHYDYGEFPDYGVHEFDYSLGGFDYS